MALLAFTLPLAAAPGDFKWSFATGGAVRSSPALGTNGLIYFGSLDSKVYAVEAATGAKKWESDSAAPVIASPAIGATGTVFVASSDGRDGRVSARDGATGRQLWLYQAGEVLSSPTLGANGLLYVALRYEGIHALDAATGRRRWTSKLENWQNVYASPCVGAGGTVYCAAGGFSGGGGSAGRFYALDGDTGRIRWQFDSVNIIQATAALGGDGTIFVPSYDKLIYALDPVTGARKWEHLTGDSLSSSPALGSDGTLFVGGNDGRLYALDSATGAEKWTFLTGDTIHSSAAIAADGTVYFGSYDKHVYALDGRTGSQRWRFATGGLVLSSPAIGSDGTVFIGSHDGKLYALEGSAPLAESPWPAFKGGELRTGSAERPGPPVILEPPAAVLVPEGTNAFLGAVVQGTRPMRFHWFFNSQPIPDATNAMLQFSVARVADSGAYTVIASNALGESQASGRLDVGYTLTIKPQGGGTVKRDPEREVYLPGSVVTLHAGPETAGKFLDWHGDAAGTVNPQAITMDGHKLVASKFEVKLGEQLWDFPAGGEPVAIGEDNTIFLPGVDTSFFALQGETGLIRWRFVAENNIKSAAAVGRDGTVVFSVQPNIVYALDAATGRRKWRVTVAGDSYQRPSIGADGTVYISHELDGRARLNALDGATGALKWRFVAAQPGGNGGTSSAVGTNGLIYITTGCDWRVTAVDATTGVMRWTTTLTPGGCGGTAAVLGSDGTVYVAVNGVAPLPPGFPFQSGVPPRGGSLHALDGETGKVRWTLSPASPNPGALIVGPDDTVYSLGNDGGAIAVDGRTGNKKANFILAAKLDASQQTAPALSADGTLYAISPAGLMALNAGSGELQRQSVMTGMASAPVAIGPDGTVYAFRYANEGPRLIAFQGTTGLADAPWPAAGRNARNTGALNDDPIVRFAGVETSDGNVRIRIRGRFGRTHHLEFKDSLQDANWNSAATFPGESSEVTLTDPQPLGRQRFYRVRVE